MRGFKVKMDLTDPEEKAYYDGILGDDIKEPPEFGNTYACNPDFELKQDKILFFNSDGFKQAEERRREASKPSVHTPVDFNRVWCPVYSKVRPEWLCSQEHGDYHEYMEEDDG